MSHSVQTRRQADQAEGGAKTRIQIPVDRSTAERIGNFAAKMNLSQSGMIAELLAATLEDRQSLAEWFSLRLFTAVAETVGGKPRKSGETVYVHTLVSAEIAEQINSVAAALKTAPALAASVLLESAERDHGWMIEAVTTRMAKQLWEALGPSKKPAKGRQTKTSGGAVASSP